MVCGALSPYACVRVCLKIAFRQLCVPLCGRFGPDEGGVAGYVDRIGTKYAAKWGAQMAGMNFQTDPRSQHMPVFLKLPVYLPCLLINPSFRPLGGNKVDKNRKFLIRFVQIVE